MFKLSDFKLFDSHFHIIDPAFPLVENQGFLPGFFTVENYRNRLADYSLAGGAIVSGSFQGFDQSYLRAALQKMGPDYVGVTQLPYDTSDTEILSLHEAGVRGVRFNLKRGISIDLDNIENFGKRIFDLAGWHVELYIDSRELASISKQLLKLPKVSIAHLGLSKEGLPDLLRLAEKGVCIKATGFGRVDFEVVPALKDIISANEEALFFGTDLPSTRNPKPYCDGDFCLVLEAFGEDLSRKIFYGNAVKFYHPYETFFGHVKE